jgi:hypothetical protein
MLVGVAVGFELASELERTDVEPADATPERERPEPHPERSDPPPTEET